MPNLRLTDTEVDQLLGYLDQESRRIAALRSGEHPAGHRHHAGHAGPPAPNGQASHTEHAGHAEHAEHAEHAGQAAHAEHAGHATPGGGR
jgi:hypothetical protein